METKQIERTFLEIVKKFLWPAFYYKKLSIRSLVRASWMWINPFIHIYFTTQLIQIIESNNIDYFYSLFIWYVLYLIIYEMISWIMHSWWWFQTVTSYIEYLTKVYMKKYISLDNNFTEKIGTGKTIAIVEKGIDIWAKSIDNLTFHLSQFIIIFGISLYVIFSYHLVGGFIFIITYFIIFIICLFLNKWMILYRDQRRDNMNLYSKWLVRIIMSKVEILQNSKIWFEINDVNWYVKNAWKLNIKMAPYFHWFFRIPELIITLIKALFLFFIAKYIFIWEMEISQLVAIFGIMLTLESTIIRFVIFFKDFTKEFNIITKLWDFFDSTPEIQWYDTGKKFKHTSGEIEIQNLSYAYNENNNVFTDFNLKIPGEKVTAIVWVSGGGKSTLVKLISGYIRADKWEIIIDGQKLSGVSLKSYYKDIGYLTQEPSVFDGTVIENLTYALDKKPTKKKLDEIIKLAKCEFIYDFPVWLDTEIWEKWIRLSGWQRQRLAIAKIFLKNPKIIILDEPTSALDSFSEEQITIAMHNLFKWRTVIIIAHRLQTVKSADDIILIEEWQIRERWTHSELVKKKWVYKRMLDLQSWF